MNALSALQQLGLSPKSAAAYFTLLQLQQAGPHQIAKEAGIERTTIYKILEDLSGKGLITKSVQGKRLLYLAEPPAQLKQFLERQEGILNQLLPVLVAAQGKAQEKPVVRFYEEKEGIKQALLATLDGKEKLRRDFASVEEIVDFLGQRFINRQVEERVKQGIAVRSLRCFPQDPPAAGKDWYVRSANQEVLREVRYLPRHIRLEPAIFIHDTTITVISSRKESFALVIQSKELSDAIKALFDMAWEMAKPDRP